MSQLGLKAGTPVIIVQIQYRLGVLGFAASSDLAADTEAGTDGSNGHVNRVGNYGFKDQRNALEWVRDHIRDFGGDPANVTAFGVSAGSASIHYHILSGDPLFDRAILMSGGAPTLGPLPLRFHETAWQQLCTKLDLTGESHTPNQRLAILRAMKPEEILDNYSGAPLGPVADGNILRTWDAGQSHPRTRCKQIIVGDTRIEAIIMDGLIQSIPQDRFQELIREHFSEIQATKFTRHFGFMSNNLSCDEYRDAFRRFLSISMFHYPALAVAESFSSVGEAYLYHFEEPSPYPGPTLGLPYHGQCALFVYQNHTSEYPVAARAVAEQMGRVWTAFSHGHQPWQPYSQRNQFMRLGPKGVSTMQDAESDETRDCKYLPWLREHFREVKRFAQYLTIEYKP